VIKYAEKGAGLHAAIARAGHFLGEENGIFISSDDKAVQTIIDTYSLADAQAYKSAEVSQLAKSLRDKAIKSISPGEMASWPIKLSEAAKFSATGLDSDAPMLSAEAAARGISTAALVTKVGDNATVFARLEAEIGGIDGKHRDAIKALDTFDAVNAYDFSAGWPEV
jgi:hypothetical protein